MDNSTLSTALWIGAAVVLVLLLLRRRGRKGKSFR